MNLENKIEAQRKRMEQEKNKLDMLMKKAKIEQRKADNHRKIVVGANFETFLNEPRRYSEEQTRRIMQVAFATKEVKNCMEQIERELARAEEQKVFGKCPNCGGEVVKGKYGAFCKNKCGMNVSRIMGVALSDERVESLLAGKKTLLKGLTSKAGKKYDAYIIPSGTEEYHYTKDGEEKSGVQFKFVMEFPKRKFTGKKK